MPIYWVNIYNESSKRLAEKIGFKEKSRKIVMREEI